VNWDILRRETVYAKFEVMSRHFPGSTDGRQEKLSSRLLAWDQDLNPDFLEYETGVLPNLLRL
jgi:hypothetical protein